MSNFKKQKYFQQWNLYSGLGPDFTLPKGIPWSILEKAANLHLFWTMHPTITIVVGGALSKRDSEEKFRLPPCIFGIGQWPKQLEHVDLRVETKNFAVCKLSHKSIWFCPQHCLPPKHIWPTLDLCSHRPWLLLLLPILNEFFFLFIHSYRVVYYDMNFVFLHTWKQRNMRR